MSSCTRPCRKGKFTAQPAEAVEDRAIQKEKKEEKKYRCSSRDKSNKEKKTNVKYKRDRQGERERVQS